MRPISDLTRRKFLTAAGAGLAWGFETGGKMKRALVTISALSAMLTCAVAAQPPSSQIDAHIAAAKAAAGLEYRATFVNLCVPNAPPAGGGAGRGAAPAAPQTPDRANWYAPPFKVFDNLYWLGTRQHSSWALQTSGGIIIIDTNFAWATEPEIIEGLTKLGLNPRDVKYVVISHAHGDHDQGAAELQMRYGAQVVMGAPDWEATLKRPATAAGGVPKRNIAVGPEGTKLTLGDTTIQIVATPGHTPGTLSYVFPVKDQGRTVMVAYSGGTLTGAFGTDSSRWDESSPPSARSPRSRPTRGPASSSPTTASTTAPTRRRA